MNAMCNNCARLGADCRGTDCRDWTGCVYLQPMTALEICKAHAAEVIRMKQEAIRTGTNHVTYTDLDGQPHTLYYTSHRWVDAGTMANIRRQFPGAAV